MDCAQVENENLAERYLLGELSEGERIAFEEHFFECGHCFEQLETLRAIQAELVAAGDEAPARTPGRGPRRFWFVAAGVAAALVAIGVALRLYTPTTGGSTTLVELAPIEAPSYEVVRLRGVSDEAQQRFRTAMEFYLKGDYLSAIPGLEQAAKLDPNAPNISFFLGACYLLKNRASEGIASLRHTISLGDTPYLEEAMFLLAKAHLQTGDRTSSEAVLMDVVALRGDWEHEARALLQRITVGTNGMRKGN